MASTLDSAPAANSSSGNVANPAPSSNRPSLRSSASTKGDGRRQSGSPVDGGQRYVSCLHSPLPSTSSGLSTPWMQCRLLWGELTTDKGGCGFPAPSVFSQCWRCTCFHWRACLHVGLRLCAITNQLSVVGLDGSYLASCTHSVIVGRTHPLT